MGAADYFDGKTIADTAANRDESSRTLSPRSPASEPAEATMKDEGCDLPTLPDEAPSAATLAASDPAGFILRDEPRTTARSSSPGGNLIGEGFARTVAVPPSTDPSSCPNQQTSDGPRRRSPGSGPSRSSPATRSWVSWAAAAWASSTAPARSA